jgi:hypothetical protein
MKLAQFSILAMIGIIIAVIGTGCMTPEAASPAPVSTAAGNSPAARVTSGSHTTVITPIPTIPGCAYPPLNPWTWVPESSVSHGRTKLPPAPGTFVSKADLFGTPSLRWDAYEYSQQIRGLPDSYGTSRIEKSREGNKGQPAIHENHTYGLHPKGDSLAQWDTAMDDMYYDDYGNMLSMHRRVIKDGEFLENRDYPPINMGRGTPDCSGMIFTPRYTFIGTDPVTVTAGKYPGAMKYVVDTGDDRFSETATEIYWFAPDVPVPVKWMIEDPEKGLFFTYELTGWG